MIDNIKRLLIDEDGTALVEYALAASLMSAAMLAGVSIITSSLTTTVNDLASQLNANEIAGY
jgi:Flp pilus assembly pilin Flp